MFYRVHYYSYTYQGLYRHSEGLISHELDDMLGSHSDMDDHTHPGPWDDDQIAHRFVAKYATSFVGNALCGFESLMALRKWFNDDELTEIYKCGFHVFAYEVPEYRVIVSRETGQALTHRTNLDEYDCTELTLQEVLNG